MALPTGTLHVAAPALVPRKRGLFSVAPPQSFGVPQERLGVVFETDACLAPNTVTFSLESCLQTDEKSFDGFNFVDGGDATYIYAGIECTLMDQSFDEFAAQAKRRLENGRERATEQAFWARTLAPRATDITPGGTPVDVVTALGLLEEYAGLYYAGQPIVHATHQTAVQLADHHLIAGDETATGSRLVIGAGYDSSVGADDSSDELPAPSGLETGDVLGGGTFAAGTYYWKVTAVNQYGETLGSNEVSAVLAANATQDLNWNDVTGATSYVIYRGTAPGAENRRVDEVGTSIYTDTGSAGFASSLPETNTTAGTGNETVPFGQAWLYISGSIDIRMDEVIVKAVSHPETNQLIALAESVFVPTVDCMVAAVLVSLE